jgi:hypothetical protein
MRASVRLGWRVAAIAAFAATAALAVTLSRGAPLPAALTSARDVPKQHATTPRCATSRLHISVGTAASTGATALGVTRYRVEFTNVSGATCALSGYPEVAAYRSDGTVVGNAAVLDTAAAARRVLLAPGESAHAAVVASVSPGACRPVIAAGLRVIPPGQSEARYIGHALQACSAAGPGAQSFLRVRAVQPGTGVATGPRTAGRASPAASPPL